MKDIPHHMMKFLKKYSNEPISDELNKEEEKAIEKQKHITPSKTEEKKLKKEAQTKLEKDHIPEELTPEEKNKLMKKRTPIIRKRSNQATNLDKKK